MAELQYISKSGHLVISKIGNVGISEINPSATLHVGGRSILDGLLTVNDGNNYAKLGDLNSNSTMSLEMKDGPNPIQIEAYSSDMRFYTGGAHRATILSGGNTRIESANKIEFLNGNQFVYSPDGYDLRLGAADDIYLQSSYIRFWSGATEYTRIATTGSWIDSDLNLGAAVAQGTYKLQVNGTAHTTGNMYVGTGSSNMVFTTYSTVGGNYSGSFGWNSLQLGNNGTNYIIAGHSAAGGALSFIVNNTTRYDHNSTSTDGTLAMRINSNGNVGIATSSPDSLLQIGESYQTTTGTNKKILANIGGYYSTATGKQYQVLGFTGTTFDESDIFTQSSSEALKNFYIGLVSDNGYFNANRFSIIGGGSEIMSFKPDSKRVGIGTTSPNHPLEVTGFISTNDSSSGSGLLIRKASSTIGFVGQSGGWEGNTNSDLAIAAETGGNIIFYTNGSASEKIRISTTGQLGINTTSPLGGKFHLKQGTAAFEAPGSGSAGIDGNTHALIIGPHRDRDSTANRYYGGIAFNHLLNYQNGAGYNAAAHAWVGLRLYDTPSSERSNLVFATKSGVTTSDIPIERMTIDPFGKVGIGTGLPTRQLEVKNSYDGSQLTLRSTSGNSGNAGLRFSVADNTVTTDAFHKASIWLTGDGTGNALGDLTFNINNVASSANVGSSDEKMRITRGGKVGIGTTLPDTELHVIGQIKSENSGSHALRLVGGNAANAQIYGTGFTYGMNLSSSETSSSYYLMSLNSGASNRFYVRSDGNVGINTTSPAFKLHVNGTGYFNASVGINGEGNGLTVDSGYDNNGRVGLMKYGGLEGILVAGSSTLLRLGHRTDNNRVATSGTPTIRTELQINTDGRVYVNPAQQGISGGALRVYYDMQLYNTINFTDSSFVRQAAISGGSGELNLYSNGAANLAIKIDASGDVGINQTSPDSTLHVGGRIQIDNPSTTGGTNTNQAIYVKHPSLTSEYFTMGFKDTARSGEKMQHPSGAYTNTSAFYIECGSTEAGGICLDQDSVHVYGSSDGGATFRVIDKDADVVTFEMLQTSWNGVFRGDVIAYGSMSSISDKRIKENIEPYENVLDKLCSLGVYSYNKITSPEHKKDRKEIGVIAQEVEQVFPELVNEEKVDKPQDVNGLKQIKTVDYEHLTAILLQSIKELREEVKELKAKINGGTK